MTAAKAGIHGACGMPVNDRTNPLPRTRIIAAAVVIASVIYPPMVYATRAAVSPLAFVAAALALIGLRAATLNAAEAKSWRKPLLLCALAIGCLAALDPQAAVKAYPAALSAAAAAVFALSLLHPPSLIERIARLREPDLPYEAQAYCRGVTFVWALWLTANAAIAALLAVAGSDEAWALWTGLIAYIVMGCLFGGEILVRRVMRRSLPAIKR